MSILKKLGTIFLLFAVPYSIFAASTGKLAGTVTDSETGQPLPGVNVVIEGTDLGAATNADGEYFILRVPVGTYTVKAQIIGYKTIRKTNVRVQTDLTRTIDFQMETEAIAGEEVVVEAERPMIQKDMTASRRIVSSDDIIDMPVESIEGAAGIGAGAVNDGGTVHFRGGRSQETVYMVDGVSLQDPLTGNPNDSSIPVLSVDEQTVITGGFGAEYGNAQSGIVNVVTKEGSDNFSGRMRYTTSDYGALNSGFMSGMTDQYKKRLTEFSLGGPIIPSMLNFFVAGELDDSNGRFRNNGYIQNSVNGKITFRPTDNLKFNVSGLYNVNDLEGGYDHEWSQIWSEDELPLFRNNELFDDSLGWYGNGQLDSEDKNMNGVLDPGEDLNNNGSIDSEDINRDGGITNYDMLNRLPVFDQKSNQIAFNFTHTLNEKSYYDVTISRYMTENKGNVLEKINEDRNYNGVLDPGEDLNGNGKLDDGESDLFLDNNRNQFIDESENNGWDQSSWESQFNSLLGSTGDVFAQNGVDPLTYQEFVNQVGASPSPDEVYNFLRDYGLPGNAATNNLAKGLSKWLPWDAVVSAGDISNGYYFPGSNGYTYNRNNWHYDQKITTTFRLDYTNQVTNNHKIGTGVEYKDYDLVNYDGPDRYGYGENYNVKPTQGAFYIQDKMEFEGIIVNAGMRFDYYDPNTVEPANEEEPVWKTTDDDFDPRTDYDKLDEIKHPQPVDAHSVWSPRLGVSHPITERDILYFNYGRYFQIPRFDYVFRNMNYNLGGGFPIIGNPSLEPEKTASYEVGVKHQFSQDMLLQVTGFYKDIAGLTDTRPVYHTVRDWYSTFINRDYGNVRGAEFVLSRRAGGMFSGEFNYTYSVAKGKSSDWTQGYLTEWAGGLLPTTESYLAWDQTHTANANVMITVPGMRSSNGFVRVLAGGDTRANIVWSYGSGTRYTKPDQGRLVIENTETLPWTMMTDLRLTHELDTGGRIQPSVFLVVNNLFNRKNIRGLADTQWYHTYSRTQEQYEDGEISKEEYLSVMDQNGDGNADANKVNPAGGELMTPTVYSAPRHYRLGIDVRF